MRRVVSILTALAVSLALGGTALARCEGYTPGPKPQNTGRDVVGKDLDAIRDRGFLEFAVYQDFPPYSYREGGKARGVDIEIGRLIADELGIEARFNFVPAGENLDADLRNNVWKGPIIGGRVSNVMLHVPYDSEFACRVEQVVFTGQYYDEAVAIAYRKDVYEDEPPVPAFFRFDSVGVENDSIADFYLSSLAGGQLNRNITRYPSTVAAMAALVAGDVKAVMGPKAQLEFGLNQETGIHQPPLPGFATGSWTVGVAVNFRYRPLAYAVDDAIRAGLESGRIEKIFAGYGLSFTSPER
ncbi:transporter substrate-binding domain-containing protein [Roseibium sp. Sym1]|uniref:transporter substrate-binding domain-containing protein n=1 Tax=Roseibium sp. Sym1 TaxID=3016006 RepID=UPI0022B41397|nr:transporter substrate-binding domain-containing protein [Roseibium sp. Sym1]